MNTRLAIIFKRFGPYHFARINAVAQMAEVLGLEVSGDASEYQWEEWQGQSRFQHVRLQVQQSAPSHAQWRTLGRIWNELNRFKPDAVAVPGWSAGESLAAIAWCRAHRVPAVLMSESSSHDFGRVPVREAIKSAIVRQCTSAIVGGRAHREYLRTLGMPEDKIFLGYDVIDNLYFETMADQLRAAAAAGRRVNSLPERFFLSVCRFIEKKNVDGLLRAFASYVRRAVDPWSLVLVGDGPLKTHLVAECERLGISHAVVFAGFKQYRELPAYYALASAYVQASKVEQWGLVVNEAMAAGLPVIVSNRCGCAPDLVNPGVNGWAFNPDSADELAAVLERVATAPREAVLLMGIESRTLIRRWSPDLFASSLLAAAQVPRR